MQTPSLTPREKEVLILICQEKDCDAIAEYLKISIHTVHSHRKNIFKKLKARTVIGLFIYAYKHKLIHLE